MNNICWNVRAFSELSTEELYRIIQARVDVFVVEQKCLYRDLDDTDRQALHLWAEKEGEILAYCRLFPQGIKYKEASIGRVLTPHKTRRLGMGRKLMAFAIEVIENRFQTGEIRISAQDYLVGFYRDFGFRTTGKKYMEDELPHSEMLRTHQE